MSIRDRHGRGGNAASVSYETGSPIGTVITGRGREVTSICYGCATLAEKPSREFAPQ